MTMTQLEARKEQLQKERAEHQSKARDTAASLNEKQQELNVHNQNIIACNGAIQDCDYWMAQLKTQVQ